MKHWIRFRRKTVFQIISWLMLIKRILRQTLLIALILSLPILARSYLTKYIVIPGIPSIHISNRIISSFAFECVEANDVLKIISDLTPKNSCGIDHVSSKLLKRISIITATPLAHIVNQSLCTGIVTDRLKIARVIPLYKKDDPHLIDNYRPISTLPAVPKVFERIVFNQLYDYMLKNGVFYASQHGFRKIDSTELASVELVVWIRVDIDKRRIPLSVFLDLSKAFDTLDHSVLLRKLNFYGISGIPLQWFSSYLTNRQQFVDFDGTFSNVTISNTGVPQGSILGPLLFIIHMNDIHEASENFHAILYADDTSLFSWLGSFSVALNGNNIDKHELSTNIKNELSKMQDWLNINKLSLNVSKVKYIIFHNHQRSIDGLIPDIRIKKSGNRKGLRIQFSWTNNWWTYQLECAYPKKYHSW